MMKYLFLVSRIASFLIDYILFYILYYFSAPKGIGGYAALLIVFFAYRVLTTAYFGATFGMMLLKLKLQRHNIKICFKREVYRFISALFFLGCIFALFDSKSRTLHDAAAGTMVVYAGSEDKIPKTKLYIRIIAVILLIISSLRWFASFVLNDIGLVGLKRVYVSDEYLQSFEGDKLISLSQDELYMKTLGRKYTTLIDAGGRPTLVRISNKLTHTEVYRLNIVNDKLVGEFLYNINMPVQFLCSGSFIKNRDLCGISPDGRIVLADEKGRVYGSGNVKISNVLTLKCGDIDGDSLDEAVVLSRGGEVEIFKMSGGLLNRIYSGKIGEDIMPLTFYIDSGIKVVAKGNEKCILYHYYFKNNAFHFIDKKYIGIESASNIKKLGNDILISHINRNAMTFAGGKIQRLEVYKEGKKVKRLYNLGSRPGRRYAYLVRSLEDVCDVDGDGRQEIIIKAVGKNDVMGEGYIVEVYRPAAGMLFLNRILSVIEGILY